MGIRNPNSTSYVHPDEPNLLDLHKAMTYDDAGLPHLRVFLGTDTITISGDVNLVDKVKLWDGTNNLNFDLPNNDGETAPWSLPTENHNMVFNGSTWDRMRGNINDGVLTQISNDYLAISKDTNANSDSNRIYVNASGTVELGSTTLAALENISATVSGTVELGSTTLAALENVGVTGTVTVQDGGGSITVDGTVNAVVTQADGTYDLVKYINAPTNLQMDMTERLRVANSSQSWWYAPTVDKDGDLRYIESATGTNAGSLFVQNLSSINMTSGTASNGSFIRISRRRHKLRPGVSMLCAFSINWNGFVPDGNVTKRVGMFTNYNGVFFEMTGDLQIVIRRRLTDGTLVEKRIARADFNIDPLDGSTDSVYDLRPVVINTSAITAYVSKTAVPISGDGTVYRVVFTVEDPSQFYVSQKGRITGVTPTLYSGTVMVTAISGNNVTFVYNVDPGVFSSLSSAKFDHTNLHNQYVLGFDFNGSRATNIRFFIDGPLGRKAIHEEEFGGKLSTPFANAPAISTRYEIFNTGAPSRLPNLTASSELVNVEAESELNPSFGSIASTVKSAFNKNTDVGHEYAICGIALRTGEPYQRADLQVQRVQIVDTGNLNPQNSGIFEWRLVLNPTVSAVPTATNTGKASRFFDYASGTTLTGGTTLISGFSQGTFTGEVSNALNFLNMGSNIDYTDSDLIVLAVKLIVGGTDNSAVLGIINYIESL